MYAVLVLGFSDRPEEAAQVITGAAAETEANQTNSSIKLYGSSGTCRKALCGSVGTVNNF